MKDSDLSTFASGIYDTDTKLVRFGARDYTYNKITVKKQIEEKEEKK